MKFWIIAFTIFFFTFFKFTIAQEYKIYSKDDGLSKNKVTDIIKDTRGFMWFGTDVGLNRFDGYKFINYYYNVNDSNSISNSNIRKIIEDEHGDLWIATPYGLNKYVFELDLFIRYYHFVDSNSISHNFINSIFLDANKNLWVTTSEGIDKYDAALDKFVHYSYFDDKENKVGIFDITQDNRGIFWLCTENDGIVSFVEETQQFNAYKGNNNIYPTGNLINEKIFEETTGDKLTIYAKNGIFDFDLKTKAFSKSKVKTPAIALNNSDSLYVSYTYTDNTGMEWYSVGNVGVVSHDYRRSKFSSYSSSSSSLIGENVSAIVEDANGTIWIGTNRGLCSYNPKNKTFANLNNNKSEVYKINSAITALFYDSNGFLWIGTRNGLYKFSSTGELDLFNYSLGHSNSLLSNSIDCIYEDSRENIWVGAGGLNVYRPQTNDFKQYKPESNSGASVNSQYIMSFYEDEKGKLWIGTWTGGINIYDPAEKTFSYIMVNNKQNGPLKTNDVGSIYKDSKGFLWFTSTGVTKYNPLNQQFTWISKTDGLPDNAIADILEDNNGMMWISTNNGLALYNPDTKTVRNFDKLDGLHGNEFIYNAAIKSRDGKLYFGGTNGFSIIDPDNLLFNEHTPNVLITDFQIFNQSVKIGEKRRGHVLLEKNISKTKEITLRHNESVFSFEFVALHYTIPEKNQYAYMLEGLEDEWNYTSSERRYASYSTLRAGEYAFRVKASNSDGVWNDEGTSVKIIVLPPWWKTNWFITALVAFLVALILAVYYLQLNSIRRTNIKLDLLVRRKTKDLEEVNKKLNEKKDYLLNLNKSLKKYQNEILNQKEEISQQNSILQAKNTEILEMTQRVHNQDQMKLRYFTNISHEFRTPLTLILSPLSKMRQSVEFNRQHADQLLLVETNAKRLLRLVNQLLDIGKIESGTMSLKKVSANFIEFVQAIHVVFKEQAKSRNIRFDVKTDLKDLFILFDFDKMEKIIYNLLSNSFKFSNDGGSITITISLVKENVVIEVSDTGIGIPKNELNKIFDPFYQVDSSSTRFHEGSGIGLYHTRELVDLINGSINISSEVGKGTTVKVAFPYESCADEDVLENQPVLNSHNDEEIDNEMRGTAHIGNKIKNRIKPALLIVEDNLELRNYIKNELSEKYNIIEASNGVEGLEMANKHHPDLIISDIMMPEMDGLEMCKTIKEDMLISHIPVILLTAKVSENDAIAGIEIGADDYIPKPFNIKFLEAKIEQLLTTRRKLKEKFSKEVFAKPSNIAFTNADNVFLQNLINLIEENMANEDFLVNDIAQEMGLGKTNLYKKVLALTNQSVADFVRNIKLKKAAQLLLSNEYSVSEVAYRVGYKDVSHFIKSFSRQYKLTPKKFVEQKIIE